MGRTLQKDLNRIAEAADTSTPEGLSFVLQGNNVYRLTTLHDFFQILAICLLLG